MIRLTSQVDVNSQEFAANRSAMESIVADLSRIVGVAAGGGSAKAVERHRARGRLLARERIDLLLDAGAPFLEFSALAAHGLYGGEVPCAGIVTGVGRGSGREGVIAAHD